MNEIAPASRTSDATVLINTWINGLAIVPILQAMVARDLDLALLDGKGGEIRLTDDGVTVSMLRTLALAGLVRLLDKPDQEAMAVEVIHDGPAFLSAARANSEMLRDVINAGQHAPRYRDCLHDGARPSDAMISDLEVVMPRLENGWFTEGTIAPNIEQRFSNLVDGVFFAPAVAALAWQPPGTANNMTNFAQVSELVVELSDLRADRVDGGFRGLLGRVLRARGLIETGPFKNDAISLTDIGRSIFAEASNLGVPTSYLEAFCSIGPLIDGDVDSTDGVDSYVDRSMNIWGSGNSRILGNIRRPFFAEVFSILFDETDLDDQPLGICDMGAGSGLPLTEMCAYICQETRRGQSLDTHPLVLIAADPSPVARQAAKDRFVSQSDLPPGVVFHVMYGDVADPAGLDTAIQQLGVVGTTPMRAHDFLHTQLFLLHDRAIVSFDENTANDTISKAIASANSHLLSDTLGAQTTAATRPISFSTQCNRSGAMVPAAVVAADLIQLVSRWKDVSKFGLLIFEPHVPALSDIGNSDIVNGALRDRFDIDPSPAIWLAHALSNQYLMPRREFNFAMALAGFAPALINHTALDTVSIAWWLHENALYDR